MEYCEGGDLEQLIENKKKFPLDEELIWKIFIQITIGLTAIHNLKILHRDLKSSNIFLTKDLNVKIGDLGVAKKLCKGNFAKTIIGTPYYLSPEICEEKPYNEKSDVWALGCILYELCTFHHPFEAKSQGALVLKILNDNPPPIKQSFSDNLRKLINLILEKNLYKRPSCKTILKLPYIIEKIKNFEMIEQYQNIGLKIPIKKNNFKKINIKKDKINIIDDSPFKKNNLKNYRIKKNKFITSNENNNDSNINKNKSHLIKKENPWATNYNQIKKDFKKDIKNIMNNNKYQKIINIDLRKKSCDNLLKKNNKNSGKKEKTKNNNISPPSFSKNSKISKEKNAKSNKFSFQKKEVKKNVKNDNKEKNKIDKNKIDKNKITVKIDLTNTLELNNIINNYLNKGETLRDSKNLENIKEFANNLNIYFSNNMNMNKKKCDINNTNIYQEKPPFILANKDNNIEQEETNDSNIQEKNVSNKKEHENIINFDLDRLTTNKLGINSFDELLHDFSASRGPTIANNFNNNLNNIKKSISPFEKQTLNNNNTNNNCNNNCIINNRETVFHVFDNKNNNFTLSNKDNNLCESDDEKNNIMNNKKLEEEDSNMEEEEYSGEENVRIIMDNECKDQKISTENKDEKEIIMEDKKILNERLESIKKDMLHLIGEKDYRFVMNLYSNIDKSKIDEIYVKIEEYVQSYEEEKKANFDMLYFKLISTDYQIQQKNTELQRIFFNEF